MQCDMPNEEIGKIDKNNKDRKKYFAEFRDGDKQNKSYHQKQRMRWVWGEEQLRQHGQYTDECTEIEIGFIGMKLCLNLFFHGSLSIIFLADAHAIAPQLFGAVKRIICIFEHFLQIALIFAYSETGR